MAAVILKGHIVVPAEDLPAVKRGLAKHIKLTLEEPGCLAFEVTQREDAPACFDVYEKFIDREAFDEHQARVSCSDWGRISMNVERRYRIYE